MEGTKPELIFENLWQRNDSSFYPKIKQLWKHHFPFLTEEQMNGRLRQLVIVVSNRVGEVVGVSTCFKVYVKQLRNHMYAFRIFIVPEYRIPGLTEIIMLKTRDFMEGISQEGGQENTRCLGMITIVENERIMKNRTEAIWPASKMVYIGNSPQGHHMRVCYFKKAMISLTPTFGPPGEGKG
jgi:hypothetical protein